VLAFPCNQFGAQEPGSPQEIMDFVASKFPVAAEKFAFMTKADVNGPNERQVYTYLKAKSEPSSDISWNFEKFLVGKDGQVAGRFPSKVAPLDMVSEIERLLG
jgi:glutathione peroxidase-family protein